MGKKNFQAGQLIPTSSTPPGNAGFYRIDKNTIGVVGNLVQKNANTNVESNVSTGANLAAELAAIGIVADPYSRLTTPRVMKWMDTLDGVVKAGAASATLTVDSSVKWEGMNTLKLDTNRNTATCNVRLDLSSYGYPVAPSGNKTLGVAVYLQNAVGKLSYINLFFANNVALANGYIFPLTQTVTGDGWYYIPVYDTAWTVDAGSPQNMSLNNMQFNVQPLAGNSDGGTSPLTVNFGGLVQLPKRKTRVVISFDDSHETQFAAAQLLKDNGLLGTFFVVPTYMNAAGGLTTSQAQAMYADGHDIAVHNNTHVNAITLGDSAYLAEQQVARKFIRDNVGGRAADHVAYVGGQSTPTLIVLLSAAGFKSGRAAMSLGSGYVNPQWGGSVDNLWRNPRWTTPTYEMNDATTVAQMLAKLDACIALGQDFSVYGHQLYPSAGASAWSSIPGNSYSMGDFFAAVAGRMASGLIGGVDTISQYWGRIDDISNVGAPEVIGLR